MPRLLVPCPTCAELVVEGSCTCPHCGAKGVCKAHAASRAAVLLGLGLALTGCELRENVSADYSAAITDADDDGYGEGEDCDDSDADIHPDATETPDDGVDSNCNNDDDT